MKNSTNIILSLIIPVCCSVAAVTGYHYMSREKTGYVRTGYILSEYEGMKSANSSYEKELQRVQNNMDTLRKRFEYWQEMSQNRGGKDTELRLRDAGNDYQNYSEKAKQQLEQRRMELTSGVIKEINSIVQAYGKKHHYKVILGATDDGSILYGDPEYDITEKILEILNRNFQQEKKSDE
jgi:outer membrane protein